MTKDSTLRCGTAAISAPRPSSSIRVSVEGWTVSPRKSRRNVSCFSSTTTGTPALASSSPSTMPAGPPPTTQTVVSIADLQSQRVMKSTHGEMLPPSLQKLLDDFDALRHVRLPVGDHVRVEETLA